MPGNKGFEFQRDLFSHIPQYLKKAHDPHWALGYHLHATRLIKSGRRPGNAPILFQLIQQLAGLADGQIFGHIAVKPLVHQLLRVQSIATRQAVDRLELVGRDRAAGHEAVFEIDLILIRKWS